MLTKLAHGSITKIDQFKYFNVVISKQGGLYCSDTNEELSGEGRDSDGMGLYCYDYKNMKEASCFTSEDAGFIHILAIEHDGYINDLPSDYISIETWNEIIDKTMDNIANSRGYDYEALMSSLYGTDPEDSNSLNTFKSYCKSMGVDYSHCDYNDYDPESWKEEFEISLNEIGPMSSLSSNVDSLNLDDMISLNDNLWDVITQIHLSFSENLNSGEAYYKKDFYEAFKSVIPDDEKLAVVRMEYSEADVVIAFDIDNISLIKVIDISKKNEKNAGFDVR